MAPSSALQLDWLEMLETSTSSSEAPPAKTSASLDSAPALPGLAEASRWTSADWLTFFDRAGWSGKMSPVSCLRTEDGRWEPSRGRWLNSGMGSRGGCWTLSTSDWPSDASVCLLSDTLEESRDVPARYSLSPKACAGILRRAEKRGKALPPLLREALEAVVRKDMSSPRP